MNKICSRCKQTKPFSDFYTDKRNSTGLQSSCKECLKQKVKKCYEKNRSKYITQKRNYQEKNKDKVKKKHNEWKKANATKIKEYNTTYFKQYRQREDYKKYKREYETNRRKEDNNYRLIHNLRARINKLVTGRVAIRLKEKDLMCPIPITEHIRSTFTTGMSWDNYGNGPDQWNIDHIIPLSKFDLSNPDECKKANHYTNLRAMWSIDNIKKSNK